MDTRRDAAKMLDVCKQFDGKHPQNLGQDSHTRSIMPMSGAAGVLPNGKLEQPAFSPAAGCKAKSVVAPAQRRTQTAPAWKEGQAWESDLGLDVETAGKRREELAAMRHNRSLTAPSVALIAGNHVEPVTPTVEAGPRKPTLAELRTVREKAILRRAKSTAVERGAEEGRRGKG